jgi:predicted DNA-binding ribbon-helix-helix protein
MAAKNKCLAQISKSRTRQSAKKSVERNQARCELPAGCTIKNGSCAMTCKIVKRSVVIAGRKKSISLEEAVWKSLREIATYRDMSFLALLTAIDSTRNQGNLSSAIRLFVLNFYREQLEIHDNKHDVIEVVLCSPILTLH